MVISRIALGSETPFLLLSFSLHFVATIQPHSLLIPEAFDSNEDDCDGFISPREHMTNPRKYQRFSEDDIFYRSGSHPCNLESITVSLGKVELIDKLEIVRTSWRSYNASMASTFTC